MNMNDIDKVDVAIIGAGASGLMAAVAASAPASASGLMAAVAASAPAASNGAGASSSVSATAANAAIGANATTNANTAIGANAAADATVVLIERNDRPGRKLSITGKGRCNITNGAEKEQFMRNIPGNGKFLFSAFSKMSNLDIVAFFERLGVGVALERGGRYFTKSGSARDVTDALANKAVNQGVRIICNERVSSIRHTDLDALRDYRYKIALKNNRAVLSKSVIIATGGLAYPSTGSTGDGYKFAESFGHTIIPPRPSLVPLETVESWPCELSGLTLKNVTLKIYSPGGGIKLFSKLGEMLFTHFGISGPLVLSASRALLDRGFAGSSARIDLKPGLSDEMLRARIERDFELYGKKRMRNAMVDLLPKRLIPVLLNSAGIDPECRADTIGKAGIARLSEAMKGLALTISAARPASEAIITAGGVKTSEINPATMESKLSPGLFFCGEVIDVDAYTGGYNLSIAFATGHVAGKSAIRA